MNELFQQERILAIPRSFLKRLFGWLSVGFKVLGANKPKFLNIYIGHNYKPNNVKDL